MREDIGILNDVFNLYYEKANKFQQEGKIELAQRNYFLAAEALMKMAKLSTAALQKAQMDRAKRIIEIAEGLKYKSAKDKSARIADVDKTTSGERARASQLEEEEKVWEGAEIPDIKFSDIAGLDNVKKAITMLMINPLKYPEKYATYKKKAGGGILLYGPPGTGKTMIAKAIAYEVGATFYAIKGSDIMSKWVGESEKNINNLFEAARQDNLAIIFLDEIDTLLMNRGSDPHNDRRVNEFLQQIDGFVGRNPNLLLLGSTNRPWDVDSAAVRSGRFSRKIYVPLPDEKAREFLFDKYLKDVPLAEDVSIAFLVAATEGFCGADIEEICEQAKEEPLLTYIKEDIIVKITKNDFVKTIKKFRPSVTQTELKRFEKYAGLKREDIATREDITKEGQEDEDYDLSIEWIETFEEDEE